jgi:CRP-like cAMP-binding protein
MTKLLIESLSGDFVQKLTASFLGRLRSAGSLTPFEEYFIEALHSSSHAFAAGAQVYTEGDPVVKPWIVGTGWACQLRVLPDGRRQIISFFLPGDSIGLDETHASFAQPTILALTDLRLLNAAKLAEAIGRRDETLPNILRACRMEIADRQAQLLDHVVRLGRLTALERMAHLLLELLGRAENAGFAHEGKFALPMTQLQLGEALGLSLVHVNRTMQQLRRDRLIELKPGRVTILDRERLELLSDFRKPALPAIPAP